LGKEAFATLLNMDEMSLYDEFQEPTETRFSKTNIFTNYKEFHNRRNQGEIPRNKDKKFFTKQLRVVNKEKQIDKRMPCWASDIELIRKVQVIQTKLVDNGLLKDQLMFGNESEKRDFLRPKMDQLCALMDRENEKNYKKIRKAREEK